MLTLSIYNLNDVEIVMSLDQMSRPAPVLCK